MYVFKIIGEKKAWILCERREGIVKTVRFGVPNGDYFALLRVPRQIYTETATMFYAENCFGF